MAPYRLWSQDLMHACLTANLLLDDRSHLGESIIMFEYENLGDYYKAERLLNSNLSTNELLKWIESEKKCIFAAKVLKNNARNACRIISFLYICSPQLKRRGIINLKILNNDKGRIDA